jgi:hypothetical protein
MEQDSPQKTQKDKKHKRKKAFCVFCPFVFFVFCGESPHPRTSNGRAARARSYPATFPESQAVSQ